jgi:amyloid beta precursor protein binding protein 1
MAAQAQADMISVRGAFAPIATTSAFVGGLVAQEAIKLVTSQYVPLDNIALVDLVKSGLEKYKL